MKIFGEIFMDDRWLKYKVGLSNTKFVLYVSYKLIKC